VSSYYLARDAPANSLESNQAAFIGDANFPELATKSSKGAKILLYESLYKQYSRLQFTKAYDRPIAIAGLEQRLVRAFNTNGGYGIFEGNFFGRSLLGQRDVSVEKDGLKKIDFPFMAQYRVPTWSWMAYEGTITFMNLPFDRVQWEQYDGEGKGIQWQWRAHNKRNSSSLQSSSSPSSSPSSGPAWHTGDFSEDASLMMRARDFVNFAAARSDGRIVYDRGTQPKLDRTVKCVVVGTEKPNSKMDVAAKLEHYVLIVAAKRNNSADDEIYERVGVGAFPGGWIDLDGPGMRVSIF
jgi:hypothetical protein